MMRTVISTVGTSLVNNARRALGGITADPDALARFLHNTPPEEACAETNCLHRILQDDDALEFVCSATPEGRLCAEALAQHYRRTGRSASVHEVTKLAYEATAFKQMGLRNLVSTLTDRVRYARRNHRDPVINATGGFKAEIAYATLVGLLFDVPVYYMHDAFNDVVELPATPVSWDYGVVFDYEEFFDWISSDLRPTDEYWSRFQQLGSPQELRVLVTEEDGYAYLSPTGEALLDAYRDAVYVRREEPIWLSNRAMKTLESADEDTRRSFELVLDRLRLRPLWLSRAERAHGSDCLVWPKGHRDQRCFFLPEDDKIRVYELARHSDKSYEALLKRGVWSQDYKDFTMWRKG